MINEEGIFNLAYIHSSLVPNTGLKALALIKVLLPLSVKSLMLFLGANTFRKKLPVLEALVTLMLFDPVHFMEGITAPPNSQPKPVI